MMLRTASTTIWKLCFEHPDYLELANVYSCGKPNRPETTGECPGHRRTNRHARKNLIEGVSSSTLRRDNVCRKEKSPVSTTRLNFPPFLHRKQDRKSGTIVKGGFAPPIRHVKLEGVSASSRGRLDLLRGVPTGYVTLTSSTVREESQPLCGEGERHDQTEELNPSRRQGEHTSYINTKRRTSKKGGRWVKTRSVEAKAEIRPEEFSVEIGITYTRGNLPERSSKISYFSEESSNLTLPKNCSSSPLNLYPK